jgi:DnaK suppressor protein
MLFDPETRDEPAGQDTMRLPALSPVLSSADLARIEHRLHEQYGELLGGVRRLEAESAQAHTGTRGRPVRVNGSDEMAPVEILKGELERTTRALTRLANGTYGTCEVCAGPIAPRRLGIIPAASRCERCAASPPPGSAVH